MRSIIPITITSVHRSSLISPAQAREQKRYKANQTKAKRYDAVRRGTYEAVQSSPGVGMGPTIL
jgi:hypothetical protein